MNEGKYQMPGLAFAWFAAYRLLLQRYNEMEVLYGWEPSNGYDDPGTRNLLVVATNDAIFAKPFPLTVEDMAFVKRMEKACETPTPS